MFHVRFLRIDAATVAFKTSVRKDRKGLVGIHLLFLFPYSSACTALNRKTSALVSGYVEKTYCGVGESRTGISLSAAALIAVSGSHRMFTQVDGTFCDPEVHTHSALTRVERVCVELEASFKASVSDDGNDQPRNSTLGYPHELVTLEPPFFRFKIFGVSPHSETDHHRNFV